MPLWSLTSCLVSLIARLCDLLARLLFSVLISLVSSLSDLWSQCGGSCSGQAGGLKVKLQDASQPPLLLLLPRSEAFLHMALSVRVSHRHA